MSRDRMIRMAGIVALVFGLFWTALTLIATLAFEVVLIGLIAIIAGVAILTISSRVQQPT